MSFPEYNTSSAALRKRKTIKKLINFSVMIVGESGLGRSTLINSLCGGNSIVPTSSTATQDAFTKKLTLRHENVELEDNDGHKISLNIIDTPNFANAIDCDEDFRIVVDFIRHQYDEVLLEESRVKRNPRFKDGRIHVLIYLINATGHGLSEIDVKFLQHVSNLVNVIPVIAKADSLTPSELKLNKELIWRIWSTTTSTIINSMSTILESVDPFAVIGANKYQDAGNGDEDDEMLKLRVLNNAWATPINVEMPEFNDFTILKNVLLITHLNEFKELTHDVIYENYRTEALSGKQFQYNGDQKDALIAGEEQSDYVAKEEQIKLEEERLKKFEEQKGTFGAGNELKEIEKRLLAEGLKLNDEGEVVKIEE
ncbi:CIC11C00000000027 [Sungouiella intermedia]|uniref:CIC11C00000000027 n=1 Tax=Sungouiella intermedia TaxID=45354 RepID=A0A1L0D9K6_9ASCO|nr:CIC11C00000000027 [[Candida] intermedia]